MFVDEVYIQVEGGKGGNGRVAFFPGIKTGPSGGHGGKGGNVLVKLDPNMFDLYPFVNKKKYKAFDGKNGENFKRNGLNGNDLTLKVPKGTLFIDQNSKESFEMLKENDTCILAEGGIGGRGNSAFTSSTRQSPRFAETGKKGQEKYFKLVLKLIADFGLIGLPNAGKSSLLNELTAAHVKTAMYPFTTLEPNLGVFNNNIIADVPGLIEGASSGKGLGIKFLKHIEKVSVLLHCISADSPNPKEVYNTVMKEMGSYNKELLEKKQIILLTKSDLVDEKIQKKLMQELSKLQKTVIPVSIFNVEQFEDLKNKLSIVASRN